MFTGIIEELGVLRACEWIGTEAARLSVSGPVSTSDARLGDSIAVNGVCVTVAELEGEVFQADLMRETLDRTTLGSLPVGAPVNLERAMRADWRFGGHIVSGHVDGVGVILGRKAAPRWEVVRVGVADDRISAQVALKGSVAVDGVSLTVTGVGESEAAPMPHWFEVSLIPTTLEHTTLGLREIGAGVNIETDVLAKYVERLMTGARK